MYGKEANSKLKSKIYFTKNRRRKKTKFPKNFSCLQSAYENVMIRTGKNSIKNISDSDPV